MIWRYQLIKQADVILLMFLLGDQFIIEEKRANFDYYEPKRPMILPFASHLQYHCRELAMNLHNYFSPDCPPRSR